LSILKHADAAGHVSNRHNVDYLKTVAGSGDLSRFTADAIETRKHGPRDVPDLLTQLAAADPAQAKDLADKTHARRSEAAWKRRVTCFAAASQSKSH
jgi:hypothetical protein